MRTFVPSLLLSAALFTPLAQADVAGIDAGYALWQQSVSGSGTFDDGTGTATTIDLKNDLQLQDERNGFFWITIEHPVPLLPNVRLYNMDFATQGRGTLTRSITFNGTTFTATATLDSVYDVTQSGGVLYYQVLDNVASLDLGIDLRNLKGKTSLTELGTGTTESASFNVWIPMLYGRIEGSLPKNLSFGGDASYLGYNGNSIRDLRLWLRWQSPWAAGIEAGYRSNSVKASDNSNDVDFTFKGPYLALFLNL